MRKVLLCTLTFLLSISISDAQWGRVSEFDSKGFTSICSSGTNIFVGSDSGVYVSTNSGKSWSHSAYDFENEGITKVYFYEPDNSLYATSTKGVYVSTDNGTNWSKISTKPTEDILKYNQSIYTCYYANFMFYSSNNGNTWTSMNYVLSKPMSMAILGDTVYCSTMSQGLLKSKVDENKWTAINPSDNCKSGDFFSDSENLYLFNSSKGWFKQTMSDHTWKKIKSPEDIYLPTGVLTYGNYIIYPLLGDGILVSNGSELIFKNSGLSNNSILGICLVGDVVYVVNPFYIQFANINDLTRMNGTEESNSLTRSVFYPNPASGVVNIRTEAEAGTRAKAVVTDLLGNAVQCVEFESCPAELQVSLAGLAAGTYCVTVYSNGQKSKSEMIIKY